MWHTDDSLELKTVQTLCILHTGYPRRIFAIKIGLYSGFWKRYRHDNLPIVLDSVIQEFNNIGVELFKKSYASEVTFIPNNLFLIIFSQRVLFPLLSISNLQQHLNPNRHET